MTTHPASLEEAAGALRRGDRSVESYVEDRLDRVEAVESDLAAWVDGPKPRAQLAAEAAALERRYPDPSSRPPLYGVPVGVKDIFGVNGLPTRAGSTLPPGELAGPQAGVVSALREAGALVFGKTVTAEFAYFEPGPTRNPHDTGHTPGGSSSGSAAAVAAGMCPLALGTQTVGSIVRPAAFCGVVGFKPSFGRVPTEGVLPLSPSVDTVGLFTQDLAGMGRAAAVCVEDWSDCSGAARPVLGVPDEAYLEQATEVGLACFEEAVSGLREAGFEVRRTNAMADVEAVNRRHNRLVAAEAATVHDEWFDRYADRYAEATADLIREGREVPTREVVAGRTGRGRLREHLAGAMDENGVDVWISPAAPGPAPEGIDTTGDPVMNLPWTHAGVPAVGLPAGRVDGLPVGLQCTTRFGEDERLLSWSERIASHLPVPEPQGNG